MAHIPGTIAGKRDRAMLLLGFAGAFRRSELAALNVEDLTDGEAGVDVPVRRSKTDQEGRAKRSPYPTAPTICPCKRYRHGWPLQASPRGRSSGRCHGVKR